MQKTSSNLVDQRPSRSYQQLPFISNHLPVNLSLLDIDAGPESHVVRQTPAAVITSLFAVILPLGSGASSFDGREDYQTGCNPCHSQGKGIGTTLSGPDACREDIDDTLLFPDDV